MQDCVIYSNPKTNIVFAYHCEILKTKMRKEISNYRL